MKKGFTIIELLMVVVLIGLLSILVIPNVNRLINKSTQTLSSTQIKSIEDSALNFITDYYDSVKDYSVFTVELKMLKDLSYVESDIKNVKTNKYFSDDSLVTFTKDGEQYKASFYGFDSDSVSSNVEYSNHIVLLKGANIFISNNISDATNAVLMKLNGNVYDLSDYSAEAIVLSTNSDGSKNITYNITLIENAKQYDFSLMRKESINALNSGPQFTISTTTNLDKSQLTMTIVPTDVEVGTNPYSFDNGVTWQASSSKTVTSTFNDVIKLKDKDGNVGTLNYNMSKLTISANGGVWNSLSEDSYFWLTNGATMTVSNPIKPGYTFNNWTLSGTGSSISGTTFTMGSVDTTITANWIANNYTLTVNANSGTWSGTTPQNIACGSTVTIPNPTRTGYTFNNWTVSGTGSSISGTTFTMGSVDTTITANWTLSLYALTVNANNGTWSGTTPQNVSYGATVTLANPTRANYVFTGWTVSGTGSTISGTTFTMGSENATLIANWLLLSSMYTYTGTSTIIDDGDNNWRIKFLTNGTLTPLVNMTIDAFLVGGGGSGGVTGVGGGGGGGYTKTVSSINLVANTAYSIIIGAGSTGTSNGGTTSCFDQTSLGGYSATTTGCFGANGGSGGSGCKGNGGSDGSNGGYDTSDSTTGPGYGQGTTTREFGNSTGDLYSGGGGGNRLSTSYGIGGAGGGGSYQGGTGGSGTANTGGGGGYGTSARGPGGSGIAIIRNHR